MKYLEIRDAKIPALGFGTFRLMGSECTDMVSYALEVGYRHIDTAQMYDNEAEVGTALETSGIPREDIFLTTKVWVDKLAYDDFKRSAETSLRKLKTDYVDLLLIHWPSTTVPLKQSLQAMEELQAAGKTRYIGVSNFPVALLKEAVEDYGADLLCDQVEYHPFLSQRPVLNYLREHGMMLTAYCPLAKGTTSENETLRRIGAKYGKSPAQVALRWLLEQGSVAAIPKTANRKRCLANLEIFDFMLSREDMADIGQLTGNHRLIDPSWAPAWDMS